jgi:endonuclease III
MTKREMYSEFVRIANDVYKTSAADENAMKELKDRPHFFVLTCIMDRQIPYEKALGIPRIVANELGDHSFAAFADRSQDYYSNLFKTKSLHRYNDIMSRAFYLAIKKIEEQYDSDASNIWSDEPSSAELVSRFLEFDSVGIKIATMAANILSRDYKIPLKDKYSIDISPDVHVKRVFYRMGLLNIDENIPFSEIDATKVVYKAREVNPEFPGILDLLCWQIGNQGICTNSKCKCNECKLNPICEKRGVIKQS